MFKNHIQELAKPTINSYKDDREKFSKSILFDLNPRV